MIGAIAGAMIMGLLGSGHCALMCGPLAMAGCRSRRDTFGYFAGRAIAYACAGAILGSVGRTFAIDGRWSLVLAAIALGYGLWLLVPRDPSLVSLPTRKPALRFLASLLPHRGMGLGVVTGALPCGLLASAWVLAASTGDPLDGALAMFAFSSASAPGLIAPLIARRFAAKLFAMSQSLRGWIWIGLALWIAVRAFTAPKGCHG
jgi:sulfite exporter TauE/SafE